MIEKRRDYRMPTYSSDPLTNAIMQGICADLDLVVEHERPRAALILWMAAIDAMAHLTRPATKSENDSGDFQRWVEGYMELPGRVKVEPIEWWAARNATLHTYGGISRQLRQGKSRRIMWRFAPDQGIPTVRTRKIDDEEFLEIEITSGITAFRAAVFRSLTEELKNPHRRSLLANRAETELHMVFNLAEDRHADVRRLLQPE